MTHERSPGKDELMRKGRASIEFEHAPHIICGASVVGPKEGAGPLGCLFDFVDTDGKMGQKSWEEAESQLQKKAAELAVQKSAVPRNRIRYAFAGDLLGQCVASSYGMEEEGYPLFGVYGACSTMGETLSLASMAIAADYAEYALCVTSSHFASAERQFRFPSDYGNQRPFSATWTVTGSAALVLGQENGIARVTGITTGRIIDYGVRDSMNMGAAMAPAAADTICRHFQDFEAEIPSYDKIITGDLGVVGQKILIELMKEKGYDISSRHMDCGIEIFNAEQQDTHAGGSGCGCSAVTLASYILPLLEKKTWKKILFVPTGALLSKISFNEGQSVPGIAHAVRIEAI